MSSKTSPRLKPVKNRPGAPLYISVKEAMLGAIRSGIFEPGQRLPSTKSLSQQLAVSLVTTHRAMQELEAHGIVDRVQGRGTFVTDRDAKDRRRTKLGLVMQPEASLADFYHGQLIEGMHRAGRDEDADLLILPYQPKLRSDCQAFLLINQLPDAIAEFRSNLAADTPMLIVGASHEQLPSLDIDNADLVRQAVRHAHRLGHRHLGYLGGAPQLSNSLDRGRGFDEACEELSIPAKQRHRLNAESWRLSGDEKMALSRMLTQTHRPTAIIAGGYYLSLDVYHVANTLGLSIPGDLTVVGVDDPPSAVHLHPPLTTVRQPLIELGHAAVLQIIKLIHEGPDATPHQLLKAELIIRESSGSPTASGN